MSTDTSPACDNHPQWKATCFCDVAKKDKYCCDMCCSHDGIQRPCEKLDVEKARPMNKKTIQIAVVEHTVRWAANMLLEVMSNHGDSLTPFRRGLLRDAISKLSSFSRDTLEEDHPEVIAAREQEKG